MSAFTIREHILPASHIREFARATANAQDEVLQLAVKEYVPRNNPSPREGDVTIVGAHANGFPKELYEALWDDLHAQSKNHGFRIRSIIIADAAWQGQSGILNENKLGNDPGWEDHTRDLLHLLNTLRPPPPLVGMAHSFGASTLASLSLIHPRLLATLVLIDPVISRFSSTPDALSQSPAAHSLHRREVWPSRDAAAASFERSPFYRKWDRRVLDAWKVWGVRELPTALFPGTGGDGKGGSVGRDGKEANLDDTSDGSKPTNPVTLTTTKHQEVATFFRPSWPAYDPTGTHLLHPALVPDLDPTLNPTHPTHPVYRSEGSTLLARLPSLRPSVLYIVGGQSPTSAPQIRRQRLEVTGAGAGGSGGVQRGRVKEVELEDRGHLLPMEVPGRCAGLAAEWIGEEMARWRAEEEEYKAWTRRSLREKSMLGEEWEKYVGRPKRDAGATGYGKPKI